MKEFSIIEDKIKINFNNKDILLQAFCHRSYINENPSFCLGHNERLEFLGDAVLELVVTEYLYKKYSGKSEGELTSLRAALVNTKILSETSESLNFGDFVLLSRGELKEDGKTRQSILANTFEALVGAIYLDSGYVSCQKFIEDHLIVRLDEIIRLELFKDAKSKFQEESQSREGITPSYKTINERGPDHKKIFLIGAYIGEELIAEGEGFSKQEGEENAAKKALEIKKWK